MTPLAHGVGSVKDLPIPQWLFIYGAAVVLVVSFVALAVLWRRPLLERHQSGRPLADRLQRLLLSRWLRVVCGVVSLFLLGVVFATALVGDRSAGTNFAPTFVYVAFWLGLTLASALFGNVWSYLNPWKAAADGVEWLVRPGEPIAYPAWAGRWPAAVLLFAFAALELGYSDPSDPRAIGLAVVVYSVAMWLGALVYGSETWFANGDAFTSYFGLLARIAPFASRDGRLVVRWPLTGLAAMRDPRPGTVAFISVMLGSVAFDGLSRTQQFQNRAQDIGSDGGENAFKVAGLLAVVLAVAGLYLAAVWIAKGLSGSQLDLAKAFAASLVPVAFVYAVSHYFSLFVVQSQFLVNLTSDPFGFGWDLFGGRDFVPDLSPFRPATIWYVQVAALVSGHVAGLALAHDRALEIAPDQRTALRTQYPLLALMVLYTVGGLWLLSK